MARNAEKMKKIIDHIENNYASPSLVRDTYLNLVAFFDEVESGSHKVTSCCTIDGLKHCVKAFEDVDIYYDVPKENVMTNPVCDEDLLQRIRTLQDENDKLQAIVGHYKSLYQDKRTDGKQMAYSMGFDDGFNKAVDFATYHLEKQDFGDTTDVINSIKLQKSKKHPHKTPDWNSTGLGRIDSSVKPSD